MAVLTPVFGVDSGNFFAYSWLGKELFCNISCKSSEQIGICISWALRTATAGADKICSISRTKPQSGEVLELYLLQLCGPRLPDSNVQVGAYFTPPRNFGVPFRLPARDQNKKVEI